MNAEPTQTAKAPGSGRLVSLDVFRGATIAAMLLVNNPGSWSAVYAPLEHAPWHGWTFTDLIFPFFLWIVGVAMPLSMARRMEQGESRRELFQHVVRRALIIFGLGFFLNSFSYLIDGSLWRDGLWNWLGHYLTNVRIPGVLQRIALCYFIAGGFFLLTEGRWRAQVTGIVFLLTLYWLLMVFWPVPGHGRGVLEKDGNFCQYIDNLVLNGPTIGTHVWRTSRTWDPEGIVSTLPAIATCAFGILTGLWLRSKGEPVAKATGILAAGFVLAGLGELMNLWLPINKNLWTSSYAVFMAGLAMLCFAVCYWVIDVRGWRRWSKPFAVYGMNAITIFVMAGIIGRLTLEIKLQRAAGAPLALKTVLYNAWFKPFENPDTAPFLGFIASPKNASLMWALMYVLVFYAIAYLMYQKKWFIKF